MKAGRFFYIIALVLEILSLVIFAGDLGNIPYYKITFLLTVSIVLVEFYAYSKHTISRGWNLYLLVLGIISVLSDFSNNNINISSTLFIIGAMLVLSDKNFLSDKDLID